MKRTTLALLTWGTLLALSGCGGGGPETFFPEEPETPQAQVETKSDLAIISAKLVDKDGNEITTDNRYEANSNVLLNITVENKGKEAIPQVDSVVYCTTLDGYTSCETTNISKLKIQLDVDEKKTFTFDTRESVSNLDNENSFSFSINIDEAQYEYDDIDNSTLFTELKKDNNGIEGLIVYVYQTDIAVTEVFMQLNDERITNDRPFSISQDNKEGNSLRLCYKLKNVGEHKFYAWDASDALSLDTEAFGNGLRPTISKVKLAPNQESDLYCPYLELPVANLEEGAYQYKTTFSYERDINNDNNAKSMSYLIVN